MAARIHPLIQAALDETGLPYAIERGSHHLKLKLAGRLVGILPLKGGDERGSGHRNIAAQIRRAGRLMAEAAAAVAFVTVSLTLCALVAPHGA